MSREILHTRTALTLTPDAGLAGERGHIKQKQNKKNKKEKLQCPIIDAGHEHGESSVKKIADDAAAFGCIND
jgi:hypothetical protein